MMRTRKFRAVIPAAGKSSRSGLNYPKTLYRIAGVPILVRVCSLLSPYDQRPLIIINPAFQAQFEAVLNEFAISAQLVFQESAKGMGDALLQADTYLRDDEDIILIWSDIPFIAAQTLDRLVNCHVAMENNFSLASFLGKNCYTIVSRNEGKFAEVLETRALGIPPADEGERDIGLFIFKKQPLFDVLATAPMEEGKEHGFLDAIGRLAATGAKVEAYPIAQANDVLSFNTPEELVIIEQLAAQQPTKI